MTRNIDVHGLNILRWKSCQLFKKLTILEPLNSSLDILRHQTRLLFDFELVKAERYEYASKLINEIGIELGGWIKQQKNR
jgi:hypothetical protein